MLLEDLTIATALGKDLAARVAPRASTADSKGTLPEEDVIDLAKAGYLGLASPLELGGIQGSLAYCVAASLELAKGSPSTALIANMTLHTIGYQREARSWPEAIFNYLASAAVTGELLNSAASEPDLGSPSRGGLPRTTASVIDGKIIISGHKTWVTGGKHLSHLLVGAAMNESFVTVWVPGNAAGVRWEKTWGESLALRASESNDLFLEEVSVPEENLISTKQPVRPIPNIWFPMLMAATYLGPAIAARDEAIIYALERTPTALGKPISSLPKIQRQIGEIDIALIAAKTVLLDTARQWTGNPEEAANFLPLAAGAKHLAVETSLEVTDKALRLVGAAAMSKDLPLERHFRDVRAGLMHPPAGEAALEIIGKNALQV
jgi:alkylation response protein AidB-like acyl-CoA dehydrogenase